MNRRQFIKSSLAFGSAAAVPGLFAAVSPTVRKLGLGERPTVGIIGFGPQGRALLGRFLSQPVVVTRVCDCDRARCEDALRAESDFRKIIEDPQVDMVCIATPDHWHAYMVVEAMKHGKDVFCEKPLTYSVDEARTIVEVAEKTGRILQTGSMQRSSFEFLTACEIVRSGMIGDVKYVENQYGGPASPRRPYKNMRNWEK